MNQENLSNKFFLHLEFQSIWKKFCLLKYYNLSATKLFCYKLLHDEPAKYPLDDGYMRLYYQIPEEFDSGVFQTGDMSIYDTGSGLQLPNGFYARFSANP